MMTTNHANPIPPVATWLGRCGLLPFVAAPIATYLHPEQAAFYARVLAVYALSIICFLVGVGWGLALIRRQASALVLSNVVVIVAFAGHIGLSDAAFIGLCAVLFPITVLLEKTQALFRPQPRYYARLREQLTLVATVSMLLTITQL